MKLIRFFFVLVLLPAWGCQQFIEDDFQKSFFVINAQIEGDTETKTSLSGLETDGKYHALWTAGDMIAVYVDGSISASDFSLVSGAGTDNGTFAGATAGSSFVGFYPSSMITSEGWRNNMLTVELPQEQIYVPGTFAQGTYPMIAVGAANNLSFKNLCAILKVSLTGEEQVSSIEFKPADASKVVSGKATVQTNYGSGSPSLVMAAGGANSVTLNCGTVQLNTTTPTDFFLVIPAGTYTGGFSLNIKTFHGTVTKTTTQDITFERSQLRAVPAFECIGSEEDDFNNVPYNQIWYVTNNNTIINLDNVEAFNSKIIRHTYENGKGIIECEGPITRINDFVFSSPFFWNITSLFLPNSIEEIGDGSLMGIRVKKLRLPDNLSYVGSYALNIPTMEEFSGNNTSEDGRCVIIKEGQMPYYGNIKKPVKNYLAAFAPSGIREYTVPSQAEILGWYSFAWCPELTVIHFQEGLKTILGDCFMGDSLDCEIVFPSSLESLEYYAFHDCRGIRLFSGNSQFYSEDGHCLTFHVDDSSWKGTWINKFVGEDVSDYVIPEGIVGIENYTFDQMQNLKSVTLPSSIVEVGSYAFNNCPNLKALYGDCTDSSHRAIVFGTQFRRLVLSEGVVEFTIPDGITSLGYNSFSECADLKAVIVPDSVIELGGYDFAFCPNLEKVVLSSNLAKVNGFNPFLHSPKLKEIYFRSSEPPVYFDTQFDEGDCAHLTVYVPEESLELYKHSGWYQYAPYMVGYHYGDNDTPDYYISSDFSADGEVTTLQTASEGNGIDIVLMGDGFSDRQIADGTYFSKMQAMANAFFSVEPYASYRSLFNVYAVSVVSQTEGYEHGGQALGSWFGEDTQVGGNDTKCMEYAQKAISSERMNNALIVVAMNSTAYAGTCYMYYSSNMQGDYGTGTSVSYFPAGADDEALAKVVHHEAGGHGFSKLGDEYFYESQGTIPQSEIDECNNLVPYGWWKNIDFTDNPATVKWSKFLSDERYQFDGLGCYEGAYTYWRGAWRPTDNSIMRFNTGGFNAPSREAIWYRMHKLAYGDSWVYNFEDFVAYDVVNRKTSAEASRSRRRNYVERLLPPTHPPVVIHRSWNVSASGH